MGLNEPKKTLIFCDTKVQADKLYDNLKISNFPVSKLHGGMQQQVHF